LRDTKECEVYIVLTPVYEGKPWDKSLPTYYNMGKVRNVAYFCPRGRCV
jgi:hypothetical protein